VRSVEVRCAHLALPRTLLATRLASNHILARLAHARGVAPRVAAFLGCVNIHSWAGAHRRGQGNAEATYSHAPEVLLRAFLARGALGSGLLRVSRSPWNNLAARAGKWLSGGGVRPWWR
jgi:hypothetical protein